ncbi:MAG: CoA transferase [Acidobacteria bacterium]|nr:CoA transferase [Acidobacteriota bacterium]MCI0627796.1 CoA transferase [Acidobacteriota bacterium]MCI0721889.1 CoA transferase [Acidobacteriota bacterium]
MLPLDGITVVALEQAVAAPFASRQLADLGARVIKIERPGVGDFARSYDSTVKGMASHFVWLNRSKESLTLNLKRGEAIVILDRLLARADVFLHNLAPGAVDRLGVDAGTLRRKYPRLISCVISGYGLSGPYQNQKAYDLLVQAEAGLLSVTGSEETPCKVGISIADIAGGMYAYSGILVALITRGKTGEGSRIEISLLEALGEWMSYPALYTRYGGAPPPRTGASHAAIAPYGPFANREGSLVYLGIQNEREWTRFCEQVLERPELTTDPRFESNAKRVANRVALHALIDAVFQKLDGREMVERLQLAQIANARMNTIVEFLEHPQLEARHRWRQIDSPVGPLWTLLPPIASDNLEPRMEPIPALGEHSEIILKELGFDSDSIAGFLRTGVI